MREVEEKMKGGEDKQLQGFKARFDNYDKIGIVIADKDQIITHVNAGFNAITGYSWDESLGRNCKFLQGKDTNSDAVKTIRSALELNEPCKVSILNYRKDGRKFWNTLTVMPIMDASGEISNYVGIQMLQQTAYVDRPMPRFRWTNLAKKGPRTRPRLLHGAGTGGDGGGGVDGKAEEAQWEDDEKEQDPLPPNNVVFVAETNLPTKKGTYRVCAYKDISKPGEEADITVLVHGEVERRGDVTCRVHDQCFTSEVLHSLKCDCREQLDYAMDYIKDRERCPVGGLIIYMPQEGRGIGLANKIKAYSMQELGLDTVDANRILGFEDDYRDYGAVRDILAHLQISSLRLMTNNPRKIEQLEMSGVTVAGRIPIIMETNEHSDNYVKAKGARMRHMLGT